MRVGVIGINHKLADLKLRESLAKACQKRFIITSPMCEDHHFILLSTCNRTEVYFSSLDLAATHSYLLNLLRQEVEEDFDQKLYSYFGQDCFCHLMRVTAGLDSAIIAETEIQGQVKAAYEAASHLPKELHFLFQKALSTAKKIRSELQLGRGMPNLEHAVLQTGKHFFNQSVDISILFVGASDINQKILKFLKSKNYQDLTICNRSDKQASLMATLHQTKLLSWNELKSWNHYDWVIVGTKSPDYLIRQQDLCATSSQKLIMDLCVPRNVEPQLGRDPRITLMNIDQIMRLLKIRHRGMAHTLVQAESRVAEAAYRHVTGYTKRELAKVFALAVPA